MARWSREGRATYQVEREALLFIFFLCFYRVLGVPIRQKIIAQEGTTIFSSSLEFSVSFSSFLLCCFAVLYFRFLRTYEYRHRAYQKKKFSSTLPGVCMCVRHPRREAYVAPELASELFFLKHGGGTLGIIKLPICSYGPLKN